MHVSYESTTSSATTDSLLNWPFEVFPNTRDGGLDWRRAAACAHLPERSVFTRDPSEAATVLRACNKCPIRRECEAVVDPERTWFDGVSGGRLWRNGREVAVGEDAGSGTAGRAARAAAR
ncbi:hypothetical protein GCM10010420_21670 [Streptomyces glaucosporus]|uniref:4Fe-4S Wbl-type domain-containing protein n=1 Tax=Streptomyces glaucosporus TaxID=284044 RepID=A0ABP5V7A8_9ACTN